ncbi:MAG: hypothetical protein JST50_04790 [Bacteroidetes bacterium]|jgi:hypothetical protein|nr:hypothetical protein [Bacteroidota bacterium]
MDLSGLTAVTTAAEMQTWLSANCLSPISPVMTGTDFGVIMQKIIDVSASAITGESNGITLVGGSLGLGGALQSSVNIDPDTHSFSIANSKVGFYVSATNPPGIHFAYTDTDNGAAGGINANYQSGSQLFWQNPSTGALQMIQLGGTTPVAGKMLVLDAVNSKGLEYYADYSAANVSNPRWLTDKQYVDDAISGNTYTPAQATESTAGIVALATLAEALAGTDDSKAMTALKTLSLILNEKKTVSYQINPVNISEVSVYMENAGQVNSLLIAGATNAKLKIGTGGTYPSGTQTYPFTYSAGDRVFISFTYTDQANTNCNIKLKCQDN